MTTTNRTVGGGVRWGQVRIKSETTKGTPITITLEGTCDFDTRAYVTCGRLVDERLERHLGGVTYQFQTPRDGATHYLRTYKNVGVGMSAAEAERVDRQYNEWLAGLPKEITLRLHRTRESLVDALRCTEAEIRCQREEWFESEHKQGTLPDYDSGMVKARRELAEFDEAHPEIIANIRAQAGDCNDDCNDDCRDGGLK